MVDAKIYELEENYDRRRTKLAKEKKQILDNLAGGNIESSNLKEAFEWAITLSLKLPLIWDSGEEGTKEKLRKLVFPNRVTYNHKKGIFLTEKVNEIFERIPQLNCISEDDKNKQGSISAALSNLVGTTGQISNLLIQDLKVLGTFINLNRGLTRMESSS